MIPAFGFDAQRWRRLPRLSQNVHPQRQHAAQADSVVDVIGVGVAGAGVEQDAQPSRSRESQLKVAGVRRTISLS
jgi:hypothetical protein